MIIVLDGSFSGIQEYIARDANNIAQVEDIIIFILTYMGRCIVFNLKN